MSHTVEQAVQLWCPFARVAQVGAIETQASYNRSIQKTHRVVSVLKATPDAFELGKEPQTEPAVLLDVSVEPSRAANCLGDKCAAWRWVHTTASVPVETQGAGHGVAKTFEQIAVKTHGFCGIAGSPEVSP